MMNKNNAFFINKVMLFFSICMLCWQIPVYADEDETLILQPVMTLHDGLIDIMKTADSKDFQARYEQIQAIVIEHFDTPLIAKVVLSRYWKSLDDVQQKEFIDLFNRLTISTYVNRFDAYSGQSFETIAIEKIKKHRHVVKTKLISATDEPVSFDYIVQKSDDNWKIISVIAKGVNDLSLKRAEYSSVIKDQGYGALLTSLEEKISDLQAK